MIYKGTGLAHAHAGLSPATRYYYAAWSVNIATQYSPSVTTEATTDFILPVTQGFNSVSMPDGWSQVVLSNNFPVTFVTTNTFPNAAPFEGSHFVKFNSFSATAGTRTRLISSYFCPSNAPHQLAVQFAWHHDPSYPTSTNEGVTVVWTTNGVDWHACGVVRRYMAGRTGWFMKTILIPDEVRQSARLCVGLEFLSQYGADCLLDAVHIDAFDATGMVRIDTLAYDREEITNYYWQLQVIHQGHNVPANMPARADVLVILLTNFFSNAEPGITNVPVGWRAASTFIGPQPWEESISNRWSLLLECTNVAAALRAGATTELTLVTCSVPAFSGVVTGNGAAATQLDATGWLPVSDGWSGPVMGVPEPLAGVLLGVSLLWLGWARRR